MGVVSLVGMSPWWAPRELAKGQRAIQSGYDSEGEILKSRVRYMRDGAYKVYHHSSTMNS